MNETLSAFDLLEGDHNGSGLRRLQEELYTMKEPIRHAMDAGLSTDDFSVAQRVLQAVQNAEEAVVRLHDKISRGES
ncbi:MAG: hypothetical protein K5657_05260 [Desulfovibrio sp.]|nr:hypothetical protein [Desulfovibrio sp.]